jgi:hypothetical protein
MPSVTQTFDAARGVSNLPKALRSRLDRQFPIEAGATAAYKLLINARRLAFSRSFKPAKRLRAARPWPS